MGITRAAPCQTGCVVSSGAQPEGVACPESRALAPLWASPLSLQSLQSQPGRQANPEPLSLGQAALRHTAGMFLHCRAPLSSQAFVYGKERPCLCLQSCWQDSSAQAWREEQQEHGTLPPRPPIQPTAQQLCSTLWTTANSWWRHESTHGLAALCSSQPPRGAAESTATIRGGSSLGHLPPPLLPHSKVSLAQSVTLQMKHSQENL